MQQNDQTNEKELVVRLTSGDKKAFCILYTRYKERLSFFAFKFLKSTEYTQDIVQDTFTHIWLGRQFINPDIPFSSYLYTIVKNRVLNQLRELDNQHRLQEHLLAHALDYSDTTRNEILSKDLKDIIQKAFETLTPRQQEIFRLSREGRMSYKEIAEKLGISVNTVHEHMTFCLHTIRQYLSRYSDIEPKVLLAICCFYL